MRTFARWTSDPPLRRTSNIAAQDLPAVVTLPNEITTKINAFMQSLELIYGAFDFIVTPGGRYVFLEVNPGGA